MFDNIAIATFRSDTIKVRRCVSHDILLLKIWKYYITTDINQLLTGLSLIVALIFL